MSVKSPCSPQVEEADADTLDNTDVEVLLDDVYDGAKLLEYTGAEVGTAYVLLSLLLATAEEDELAGDEVLELKVVDTLELREVKPPRAEVEAVGLEAGEE